MIDENPYSEPLSHSEATAAALPEVRDSNTKTQSPARKPKKTYGPAITMAMVAIASFVGFCTYQNLAPSDRSETSEAIAAEARLPVRVVQVQTGLVQEWVFDEGVSLPVQTEVLTFQAEGQVTYIVEVDGVPLKEGDFVAQGQLLATIDDRQQAASMESADADIRVAVSQRNQAEATLSQTRANLKKAESDLALAETELQRYQMLYEQGAVPASERDVSQNQVDQAQAALQTAREDVRSAEEGVRSAAASVEAAQAQRNKTAVDLEETQLVSPINGVVAYINIQEGDYWGTQSLDSSSAQRVIETAPIVVVNPQAFEVELEIQATGAEDIRPGQKVYVVLEDAVSTAQAAGAGPQNLLAIAQQQGSAGTVFAVSPSQTPDGRGTKVTVRDFQQVRNLKVGGRVYVWIEVAENPDAVVVPLGAVISRDQQFSVFVVDEVDSTVQRRPIRQGIRGFSEVGVLAGVEPGELVVVEGQNRLVDGTPVEIVNPDVVSREMAQ